ncbi:S8 family serine peptidase [Streptomyces sp. NPDC093109]|uniref:S8 family serine peptidase n=1 Tax=Streptomyces sp. NPDC093109 TaxID=3154977 RepID=UPI00344C34CB
MQSKALRRRWRTAAVGVVSAVVLIPGMPVASAQPAVPGAGDRSGGSGGGPVRTVVLVTGDRVLVGAGDRVVGIERAEGRENAAFSVRTTDGHTHVVPVDARPLLAAGKLDARLFDVTRLLEYGYGGGDGGSATLPLITSFTGRSLPPAGALKRTGIRTERTLPTVNSRAMRLSGADGSAFWDAVTEETRGDEAPTRFAAGTAVKKVWLDGQRKASLDRSVAQIGAPTAWEAGYDGSGVTVAVLDTGIDTGHPDLAAQVVGEKVFAQADGPGDAFGHGTHVASTVAGTGAKSGGRYRGVAPGAKILNGKVLDDNGDGYDSEIIAGMEWAVAEGADVVNLSLGGDDSPGIDPMEETVNRLSAETDTLFVIAAGNSGDGESTVGSPGSADAALTVGAVDTSDVLADFSSRGPRVGDAGVKPDLTAPGVAIMAAAAAGSVLEQEVPSDVPGYLAIDGTSMATPHVAGAAAILAQRHPDWSGRRIKAALTGSAEPGPYSSFQQGTGRTEVVRAMEQEVIGETGPLGFGLQQWPHDDDKPVTKQVTYRNLGTEPVTLELSADARAVDGTPAAEGMFTVSPEKITVPAGGTASADVTSDTRAGSVDGSFGGAVTAASADGSVAVRTAVGVEREKESYTLTLKHLDAEGRPTGDASTSLIGIGRQFYGEYANPENGEVTARVPAGDYALSGVIHTQRSSTDNAILMRPRLKLDRDTSVTVDARDATPMDVTVPDSAAVSTNATVVWMYDRSDPDRPGSFDYMLPAFEGRRFGMIGGEPTSDDGYALYSGSWARTDGDGTPVNYRAAWVRRGDLGGFADRIGRERLARTEVLVGSPGTGRLARIDNSPRTPEGDILWSTSTVNHELSPSARTTEYVLANDVSWSHRVWQGTLYPNPERPFLVTDTFLMSRPKRYEAGSSTRESFNIGVFGPGLDPSVAFTGGLFPGAERRGNTIKAFLPLFGDGAGNMGLSDYTSVESSFLADGTEIESEYAPVDGTVAYEVPAGDSPYRLTMDVSRDPAVYPVSTRVAVDWAFRSAKTPEDGKPVALPLSSVRFSPELSVSSTAPAGGPFTVPFTVEGAPAGGGVKKLAFSVSYDEGASWQRAKAVGGDRLRLTHPAGAGSVSLRAELTDRAGNTLTQTIERAYLIAE